MSKPEKNYKAIVKIGGEGWMLISMSVTLGYVIKIEQ